MELLKNNKGITLIILVVTIIVLLILAGISISAITGGDSSMDKAKKAKDETAIKAEMEELQKIINQSAAKGIRHGNFSGSADSQTIRDALKKNKLIEENPDDVIIDGKNGWKVTGVKTGQKYKIRYNGEVTRIEELAPTKIYGKIADNILYLRATEQTGYTEGTKWNDNTITKVIIEEPIAPSTCEEMFKDCTTLETIENIENLHTENAVSMESMFNGCISLSSIDVSNLDTPNVTNMQAMFYNCSKLTDLNLSNFDTSNVTTMANMFTFCSSLSNLDVSKLNTSKVTNMDVMFYGCSNLTILDVSKFNTGNVTNMRGMFGECRKILRLDVSKFNTSNVTNMRAMFYFCDCVTELDLRSFETIKVTTMYNMFAMCRNLNKIYVSDSFVTTALTNTQIAGQPEEITNSTNIFNNCLKIIGGAGTTYDASHTDKAYARIDGGPSNPGYFTLKQ